MVSTVPALCGSVTGKPNPFGVRIHEAGYRELGLNFKYVSVGADDLEPVVRALRTLRFRGFGVSMPFKQQIIGFLDEVSDDVKAIGACNTVVAIDDRLRGENTDWTGALSALKEVDGLGGTSAVIIGAGGVARAIAYGLKRSGYKVFVSARNPEAARAVVRDLALDDAPPLDRQGRFAADLIVNATPQVDLVGPVNLSQHSRAAAFLDVIGDRKNTPLTIEARRRGLRVAPGWRMRLHQACSQFELYTGHPAPQQVMSDALESALDQQTAQ
jgi:shikimate dehydrogenase